MPEEVVPFRIAVRRPNVASDAAPAPAFRAQGGPAGGCAPGYTQLLGALSVAVGANCSGAPGGAQARAAEVVGAQSPSASGMI